VVKKTNQKVPPLPSGGGYYSGVGIMSKLYQTIKLGLQNQPIWGQHLDLPMRPVEPGSVEPVGRRGSDIRPRPAVVHGAHTLRWHCRIQAVQQMRPQQGGVFLKPCGVIKQNGLLSPTNRVISYDFMGFYEI